MPKVHRGNARRKNIEQSWIKNEEYGTDSNSWKNIGNVAKYRTTAPKPNSTPAKNLLYNSNVSAYFNNQNVYDFYADTAKKYTSANKKTNVYASPVKQYTSFGNQNNVYYDKSDKKYKSVSNQNKFQFNEGIVEKYTNVKKKNNFSSPVKQYQIQNNFFGSPDNKKVYKYKQIRQQYQKQANYKRRNKNKNLPIKRNESILNEMIRTNDPKMFDIFRNTVKKRRYYKKQFKPKINEKGYNQKTALHEIMRNKNCPTFFLMEVLKWGPEVDAKDWKSNTPLHYAAGGGNTQKAYWLLKYNADVNAQNRDGYTPLHLACKKGNIKLVKMLLDFGAIINIKNNFLYTPLHFAAESSTPGLVYMLLDYGAYCHVKTAFNRTPLMRSIQFGNKDDIALLLNVTNNFDNDLILKVCPNDNIKAFVVDRMQVYIRRRCWNILRNEFRMITSDKRSFINIAVGIKKPMKKQNYYDAPKRFKNKFQ